MKATIWGERVKSECDGPISAVVINSFNYIPTAKARETALKIMTTAHQRLLEIEKRQAEEPPKSLGDALDGLFKDKP